MKKTIIIISLLSIVFSATELYQLLKIPVLIAHYFEHQDKEADMGIAEFFMLHYSKAIADDEDADRDMQLPFKTHECHGQSIVAIQLRDEPLPLQSPIHEMHLVRIIVNEEALPTNFLHDIWQPPRTLS